MIGSFFKKLRSKLVQTEGIVVGNYIRSVRERAWDKRVIDSVGNTSVRSVAVTECYTISKNQPPWIRSSKSFDEEYIYQIKDAFVSPSSGVVWLNNRLIIGESYGSLYRLLINTRFKTDYFSNASMITGEEDDVIPFPSPGGFFHFVFETLPAAIAAIQEYPSSKLLIHDKSPRYVLMFASLISDRAPVSCAGPARFRSVIVAGKTPFSGFVQKSEIKRLREFILTKKFPSQIPSRKIYISRLRDQRRQLANEKELLALLETHGYETCFLQDMTINDQIKLFQQALTVVAPHGAGLANLLWSNPGTKVLEIFPDKPRNDCYARLAVNLELHYDFVICGPSPNSAGSIPLDEVKAYLSRQ
jgi:hypothetical protein